MRPARIAKPARIAGPARIALVAALASVALVAGVSASGAQASFGPEVFEAGTCTTKTCTYKSIEEGSGEQFTQAAGHPPWGGTKFIMKHSGSSIEGASVKRIRVDVPPGLAANPQAPVPKCPIETFEHKPSECPPQSVVGTTEMEAVAEPLGLLPVLLPKLEGTVYNLEAPTGLPLDFGIAVEPAGELITPIHLFLEGHVSWAHEPSLEARGAPSGDYHEYFEINNVPNEAEVKLLLGVKSPLKVLMSKLNFNGHAGGNFLTLPSVCSNTTTSYLELESWSKETAYAVTHTPVGVEGCDRVPFKPTTEVKPATAQSDAPDGAMTVVKGPQHAGSEEIDTADIDDAHVTLPEGLTLNPSAAHGLEACTPAQIGIGTTNPVTCPAGSRVGTVTIETDLPPGSLTGNVYLGSPDGTTIENPPYTIYLEANATGVDPKTGIEGVSVRLRGSVNPNPVTGRLEVSFENNPELPFSELRLALNSGERAPLANPLTCGNAPTESLFIAYSGEDVFKSFAYATPFEITGCANPLPFSLSQTTTTSNPNAGGYTNFTFNLVRSDGQQYLSQIQTTLPPGLVGLIPSVVTLCGEAQANEGTCPSASEIGTASVTSGAGEAYPFAGKVYLTGPYNGAPYGLSIVVPAIAGPFNLGDVVTRAQIAVDPHTGRVIVTSSLPSIARGVGHLSSGVPLRLRTIGVTVNRPNFMINPTNCGALSDESTLTSTFGATQGLSSPFQVGNCGALAFKPSFAVSTSAHTSKANGASLRVALTQPAHEANIASVFAQLPAQLVSRLTTLQKACPEATFAANPIDCRPLGSEVGTATVTTPVLPSPPPGRDANLSGSAYLVSHGGAAFPDLDLVLEGDDGVRVILVGHTDIKKGITTSNFASVPDVPVSSFVLNLPVGPHSALTGNGNLCTTKLIMPTIITAQNGAQVKQSTRISVAGCGVRILSERVRGHELILEVRTLGAGLITVKGKDLRAVSRRVRKSATVTFKLPLTRGGLRALRRHKRLKVTVRVVFVPAQKGASSSSASTGVRFRR
jgi:hypothetical protein